MWRSYARILSHVVPRANGHERGRETQGPESEPMPIELHLQDLDSKRRFDRCREGPRCGHADRRAHRETGMAGQGQQECEANTTGECPRETDPATHQEKSNRVSSSRIRDARPYSQLPRGAVNPH
jgi:hypothetical protein